MKTALHGPAAIRAPLLIGVFALIAAIYGLFGAQFRAAPARAAGLGAASTNYVPGQVLVKLRAGVVPDAVFAAAAGLSSIERLLPASNGANPRADQAMRAVGLDRLYLATLADQAAMSLVLAKLRSQSLVEYAEPNYLVTFLGTPPATTPNDPLFSKQWGLSNSGQLVNFYNFEDNRIDSQTGTPGADIKATQAWAITTGDQSMVVGVIDSGVDYSHPDLAANMWNGGPSYRNHGYNFAYPSSATAADDPMDLSGHGTSVAGIIGAVGNNSVGVAGVNWRVQIAALKISDPYVNYPSNDSNSMAAAQAAMSAAIQAIHFADQQNIKITNNSWGVSECSSSLHDTIAEAQQMGHLFIAAAGNTGQNTDSSPLYPAAYSLWVPISSTSICSQDSAHALDNIISVGATDNRDVKATWSSYGSSSVHLGAPGAGIASTTPWGGQCSFCNVCGGDPQGYESCFSGTSMATANVSGAAALLWSHTPGADYREIKSRILSCTDPNPSLKGITISGGRLNIYNALNGAIDTACAPGAISSATPIPTPTPSAIATPTRTATPTATPTSGMLPLPIIGGGGGGGGGLPVPLP